MKTKFGYGMVLAAALFISGASVMAADAPGTPAAVEVRALIKCHEGKFNAMNAVSQLNAQISGERDAVYGWSGIGAYPDGHMVGHLVFVRQPVKVSAPSFVQSGSATWACVTVEKQ